MISVRLGSPGWRKRARPKVPFKTILGRYGIVTKAIEWEILPDSYANPMHKVKLPAKWAVREKRILSEDETVAVLARLEDPSPRSSGSNSDS